MLLHFETSTTHISKSGPLQTPTDLGNTCFCVSAEALSLESRASFRFFAFSMRMENHIVEFHALKQMLQCPGQFSENFQFCRNFEKLKRISSRCSKICHNKKTVLYSKVGLQKEPVLRVPYSKFPGFFKKKAAALNGPGAEATACWNLCVERGIKVNTRLAAQLLPAVS